MTPPQPEIRHRPQRGALVAANVVTALAIVVAIPVAALIGLGALLFANGHLGYSLLVVSVPVAAAGLLLLIGKLASWRPQYTAAAAVVAFDIVGIPMVVVTFLLILRLSESP